LIPFTETPFFNKANAILVHPCLVAKNSVSLAYFPSAYGSAPFSNKHGCTNIALALLKKGVSVNGINNSQGETMLMLAARQKSEELVKAFIKNGANLNAITKNGQTALTYAIQFGNTKITTILIENEANVNAICVDNVSPLIVAAAQKTSIDTIKALLEKGSNVNAIDTKHQTALMHASYNGSLKMVEILIEFGADVHVKNCEGKTAIHWSTEKKHDLITVHLLQFGAGVNEDRDFIPIYKVQRRIEKWNRRIRKIASVLFPDDTPVIAQIIAEFTFGVHYLQNYIKKHTTKQATK
jgi:ankyrin repeat protein